MTPSISVIIPTLNEEKELPETLAQLHGMKNLEVIVADCGSKDRTVEIARVYGTEVISTAKGRGTQLNSGVEISSA